MILREKEVENIKSKKLNELQSGDFLKKRTDNLYYKYEKEFVCDNLFGMGKKSVYASFFGFVVEKNFLNKYFETNGDTFFCVYKEKE